MKFAFVGITALLLSGTAIAQSAEPAPAPAPEAAAPAGDATAPEAATNFTDEQIDNFASAMVKIQGIAQDATIDEAQKQTQMVSIVQATGLDPETFNAIGAAAQSDHELNERVQIAFANAQGQPQNQ